MVVSVKYNLINRITAIVLVLLIFTQNPPWFIWGEISMVLLSVLTIVLFYLLFPSLKFAKKKILFLSVLVFLFFIGINAFNTIRISTLFVILIFYMVSVVSHDVKRMAFDFFLKYLAIIVGVSLIAWLINIFVVELPYFMYPYPEGKGSMSGILIKNYFLFVQPSEFDSGIPRFYSVFDEPGVLGTLSAFTLFGNKYNLKDWRTIVILIGSIFTFSFAFFVLSIVGVFIFNRLNIIKFLSFLIVVSSFYFILKDQRVFQNSIISRSTNVSSSSLESRTGDNVNFYFSNYIFTLDVIIGNGTNFLGAKDSKAKGALGYKSFIIEYGLIGILLLFLMYYFLINELNYFTLSTLVLFMLSFLQRSLMFTPYQIILFTLIISQFQNIHRSQLKP